ncbi:uncharacterized protein LOC142814706 [Rhipicephalus microplus]|uniref:uncharacterized protein LOC142814706 n=1 Tax=Rhipicephalus microplus TaxID=6941 RepID=UPI003F6B9CB8
MVSRRHVAAAVKMALLKPFLFFIQILAVSSPESTPQPGCFVHSWSTPVTSCYLQRVDYARPCVDAAPLRTYTRGTTTAQPPGDSDIIKSLCEQAAIIGHVAAAVKMALLKPFVFFIQSLQCSLLPDDWKGGKVIPVYKSVPSYVSSCIDHPLKVGVPNSRTNLYLNSFVPTTSVQWNHLPASIVSFSDAAHIKSTVSNHFL